MSDDTNLPDSGVSLVVVRLSEEGLIVDTRGLTLLESYTLLTKAADAVYDRMEDGIVIADDEDAELIESGVLSSPLYEDPESDDDD